MATVTTTPNTEVSTGVDIKSYNETYRVYGKAIAEGKDAGKIDEDSLKLTTAGKDNAIWKKLEEQGYTNLLEQSVKIYSAGTWDGAAQIITDPEERTNIFNRGVSQKTGQKLKAALTEVSEDGTSLKFDPQVEPLDTMDMLNEETRRRNLSPEDKATKGLREVIAAMNPGLSADEVNAKVAEMLAFVKSA